MERETGIEPATFSLGNYTACGKTYASKALIQGIVSR
jgi:hypothetical protein